LFAVTPKCIPTAHGELVEGQTLAGGKRLQVIPENWQFPGESICSKKNQEIVGDDFLSALTLTLSLRRGKSLGMLA
jgi:hypothetical protein